MGKVKVSALVGCNPSPRTRSALLESNSCKDYLLQPSQSRGHAYCRVSARRGSFSRTRVNCRYKRGRFSGNRMLQLRSGQKNNIYRKVREFPMVPMWLQDKIKAISIGFQKYGLRFVVIFKKDALCRTVDRPLQSEPPSTLSLDVKVARPTQASQLIIQKILI